PATSFASQTGSTYDLPACFNQTPSTAAWQAGQKDPQPRTSAYLLLTQYGSGSRDAPVSKVQEVATTGRGRQMDQESSIQWPGERVICIDTCAMIAASGQPVPELCGSGPIDTRDGAFIAWDQEQMQPLLGWSDYRHLGGRAEVGAVQNASDTNGAA